MIKSAVRRIVLVLSAGGTALALMQPAGAAFPERPVKVVVPYGPGGGVDTFTRPLAMELSRRLGQPMIVDNRAGAGGTIGVKAVAGAPADGHTLLSGGVHQPMAESLYPNRGYDMSRDFVPVALTAIVPNVLVMRPDLPAADVAQLIAYARANPEKLTYCSSGSGTSQHIIAEMFKGLTRTEMLHVPHKGTAAAMTTLLSGHCDLMFDGLATSIPHIRSGKLRALALTTSKRSRHYPEIPTMQEGGGPAMDAGTWYGWWVPAKTPRDILEHLRSAVAAALDTPEIQKTWALQGAEVPAVPASNVEAYVEGEIQRWSAANRKANIRLD